MKTHWVTRPTRLFNDDNDVDESTGNIDDNAEDTDVDGEFNLRRGSQQGVVGADDYPTSEQNPYAKDPYFSLTGSLTGILPDIPLPVKQCIITKLMSNILKLGRTRRKETRGQYSPWKSVRSNSVMSIILVRVTKAPQRSRYFDLNDQIGSQTARAGDAEITPISARWRGI